MTTKTPKNNTPSFAKLALESKPQNFQNAFDQCVKLKVLNGINKMKEIYSKGLGTK